VQDGAEPGQQRRNSSAVPRPVHRLACNEREGSFHRRRAGRRARRSAGKGVGTGAGERPAHQAAAAHLILSGSGVEPLATSSLGELSRRMSSALGVRTELRDPSGTGYKIVGARIVPLATGRAVQLVMRGPADETITFYFEGRPGAKETPVRRIAGNGLTTLVWEDDDLACAITGTLEPEKLEEVGRRIYDALLG
jgi:anti-sigma factor RsiW